MKLTRRHLALAAACCAALLITAARTFAEPPPKPPTTQPAASERFIRYDQHADGSAMLQTSILHFQNAAGQKVDLVGAVHVADPAYYADLNERFKNYDAVLYEMVRAAGPAMTREEFRNRKVDPVSIGGFQRLMRDELNLRFQLEEIDYTPENFVHADLDPDTFFKKQDERNESMFKLMMRAMFNSSAASSANQPGIMDLLNALRAPDRPAALKRLLGKAMLDMDKLLDIMEGPDGSAILSDRNDHAMAVLKEQLAAGRKNIAVFYGSAHLQGMGKIMTETMGFKQVGEIDWLDAWNIPAPIAPPQP